MSIKNISNYGVKCTIMEKIQYICMPFAVGRADGEFRI